MNHVLTPLPCDSYRIYIYIYDIRHTDMAFKSEPKPENETLNSLKRPKPANQAA